MKRLEHFPVGLFATVMGVAGLSLAWRRAHFALGAPSEVGVALALAAGGLWVVLALAYAVRWMVAPGSARTELTHPMKMPFTAAITVGLLLVATALSDATPTLASAVWWVAAPSHLMITVLVLRHWISHPDVAPAQVLPTWFIPVVGNLVTPLAGPAIGNVGLSWLSFGVGLTFWIALLPVVLGRYMLVPTPVAAPMTPVFAIFVAPPAVAMLAAHSLVPTAADGAHTWVLYTAAVAFAVLFLALLPTLRRAPYGLPWWAVSFPLASLSTATTAMAALRPGPLTVAAWALLTVATVTVLGLTVLTSRDAARGRLLVSH